jgi:hypothetical protein
MSPFSVCESFVSTWSGKTLPPPFTRALGGISRIAGVGEGVVGGFAGTASCSEDPHGGFGGVRVV